MSEPTYIVSGFPRSGTSMMMRALDAGGIPAVLDAERENDLRRTSTMIPGYDPNPHGFFETSDPRSLDWPSLGGKCVKVMYGNIPILPNGSYRAVYMTRDPAEIARSFAGVVSIPLTRNMLRFLDDYEGKVQDDVALLESKVAEVVKLQYADVVNSPEAELSRLNWPIDIALAAAMVDPALYRHRGAA